MRNLSIAALLLSLLGPATLLAAEVDAAKIAGFQEEIEPLLEEYCYGCHAYGAAEGNVAFDAFESTDAMFTAREHWWKVLKNVRADVMPPAGEWRPGREEKQKLIGWITTDVFGIDPDNPDPGRVTARRLNRIEYRNTVRDLLGVDFEAEYEFPPDDSGHGFDNIGDVLTVSPLLVEKYLEAADSIISEVVPTVPWVLPVDSISGDEFTMPDSPDSEVTGRRISFYDEAAVRHATRIEKPGRYRVVVDAEVDGSFDFDPGRCRLTFKIDGEEQFSRELAWQSDEPVEFVVVKQWEPGRHELEFVLEPLVPEEQRRNSVHFEVDAVRIEGPLDERVRPERYDRFFHDGGPPEEKAARAEYTREVLRRFATRAFRRPVDTQTLERLAAIVEGVEQQGGTYELGVARAMTAVLASPQFLFRIEDVAAGSEEERFPLIDEYALASRLSYFLWSTMPDGELFALAEKGELRNNLRAQVRRMLEDERRDQFISHFVGQWLQARDIEIVPIDALAAAGVREEYDQLRAQYRKLRDSTDWNFRDDPRYAELRERLGELRPLRDAFDQEIRLAMRRETEMSFEHVVREDKSVLDLIDSDYGFFNERLAEHYGLEGVDGIEGDELRRVDLPADSVRGGVLTQGAILAVTSNPTRTSPVKRGLFVLENILGTPTPPPPAAVPELEAAKEGFAGEEPTLRELLELHRQDALCSSCHARFDPLGLGLENLDAMGRWRDLDAGKPIDASGQLITGEQFENVKELKQILRTRRRMDFYRCLAERLLTYALGRGLDYYDEVTVDRIATELDADNGRFSTLLFGIIESAPMQRQRR